MRAMIKSSGQTASDAQGEESGSGKKPSIRAVVSVSLNARRRHRTGLFFGLFEEVELADDFLQQRG